jgi:hypothetical protein
MYIQQIPTNCDLSGRKVTVTNCESARNGVHNCDIKLTNVTPQDHNQCHWHVEVSNDICPSTDHDECKNTLLF